MVLLLFFAAGWFRSLITTNDEEKLSQRRGGGWGRDGLICSTELLILEEGMDVVGALLSCWKNRFRPDTWLVCFGVFENFDMWFSGANRGLHGGDGF